VHESNAVDRRTAPPRRRRARDMARDAARDAAANVATLNDDTY
jgi:hypothetical protein